MSTSSHLVEAIRNGCPEAQTKLFAEYRGQLLRVLGRTLGQDSELYDLLQDVFVIALQSIGRLEDPEALPGWLTQIAINVARGHVRRRVRRRALAGELTWLMTTRRPHLDHIASEAALAVAQVFERLPRSQRAPFALRFLWGLELSEVASVCQLSIPTVKRRLNASRRRCALLSARASVSLAP